MLGSRTSHAVTVRGKPVREGKANRGAPHDLEDVKLSVCCVIIPSRECDEQRNGEVEPHHVGLATQCQVGARLADDLPETSRASRTVRKLRHIGHRSWRIPSSRSGKLYL